MFIPFGEYLPDHPPLNNPGTTNVLNVVPSPGGYRPFYAQSVVSDALTARAQGATSARDKNSQTYIFAGDSAALYELTSTSFTDISDVGGYTTNDDDMWDFTQFNDIVIATNFVDPVQKYELDVDSTFSEMAASAPKARYCSRIRDFVVLGNINDGTLRPNRVQWSPFDDPTGDWTVSSTTQADYQDLNAEGGWIKRIVGGEYGVIFQERAIWRMTYVGDDIVFQFDEVETGRGTQAPLSVVKIGNIIFYLGNDGFYLFNGSSSTPIGENKVNKAFFSDLDANYIHRVSAALDARENVVYVAYPGSGSTDGTLNKMLAFSLTQNRWAPIDQTDTPVHLLFNPFSSGFDLDSLDTPFPGGVDSVGFSVDSSAFTGGRIQLAAIDNDNKLAYFSGDALDATLETGETRFGAGASTVFEVRPIVEGFDTLTITPKARTGTNDNYTSGTASSPRSNNGSAHMRSRGQYHRFLVTATGGFDTGQGVDVWRYVPVGTR